MWLVLAHHGAAVGDALLVDEEAEIVPDRRLEFRLHLRQAQDLLVGLRDIERAGGDGAADAGPDGRFLQPGDAGGKACRGGAGGYDRQKREQGCRPQAPTRSE